jgi:hypothetical protein
MPATPEANDDSYLLLSRDDAAAAGSLTHALASCRAGLNATEAENIRRVRQTPETPCAGFVIDGVVRTPLCSRALATQEYSASRSGIFRSSIRPPHANARKGDPFSCPCSICSC